MGGGGGAGGGGGGGMSMMGMGGGGGGGGMMGGMGMEPKVNHAQSQHGRGEVCADSAGSSYGKWIGTAVGTIAGSYFGMPGLGQAGGMMGQGIGSQIDPIQCVGRMNPNEFQPPSERPGISDPGASQAEATTSTQTPPLNVEVKPLDDNIEKLAQKNAFSGTEYDPYSELVRKMTDQQQIQAY